MVPKADHFSAGVQRQLPWGVTLDLSYAGSRSTQQESEFRGINEAHNGYLEIILHLGIVGLVLFGLVLLSAYLNCRRRLFEIPDGRMMIALFFVAVVYNVAESGFRGLSLIAFTVYFVSIRTAGLQPVGVPMSRPAGPRVMYGRSPRPTHPEGTS